MRTAQWRYIRYADGGEELYDETKDPYEWTNLANDRRYGTVKAELAKVFPNQPEPKTRSANRRANRGR